MSAGRTIADVTEDDIVDAFEGIAADLSAAYDEAGENGIDLSAAADATFNTLELRVLPDGVRADQGRPPEDLPRRDRRPPRGVLMAVVVVHEETAGGWTACGLRVSKIAGDSASFRQDDATCERCAECRARAERYLAASKAAAPTLADLFGRGGRR